MADDQTLEETPVDPSELENPAVEPPASAEVEASPEATTETESQAAPEQEWVDIRSAAQEAGYDLSSHGDDEAALSHLIKQAQQVDELSKQSQQWQQMASSLYQEQQKATQQPPPEAPQEPQFWNAPEYNPNWLTQVDRDEAGNLIPSNGGTAETVAKLQNYLQYRSDQQSSFWDNPFEYMKPYIDHIAEQKFASGGAGMRAEIQEQHQAEQFIRDNGTWLFDEAGGLSNEGKVFQSTVGDLANKGYSQQDQQSMAFKDVQLYRAQQEIAKLQKSPAETAEDQRKATLKKEAGFTPNVSGTENQTINSQTGESPPQNPNQSLNEMMKQRLLAAGIKDEDMARNY